MNDTVDDALRATRTSIDNAPRATRTSIEDVQIKPSLEETVDFTAQPYVFKEYDEDAVAHARNFVSQIEMHLAQAAAKENGTLVLPLPNNRGQLGGNPRNYELGNSSP